MLLNSEPPIAMDISMTDHSDNASLTSSETAGSIINRKREAKGLPSSFSANLSRRVSPPRVATPASPQNSLRSVKAIVAWLESSPKDAATNGQTKPLVGSPYSSRKPTPLRLRLQHSQPVLHATPDVEEYSLTLLKYQQYYTQQPLGRCLDDTRSLGESADLATPSKPAGEQSPTTPEKTSASTPGSQGPDSGSEYFNPSPNITVNTSRQSTPIGTPAGTPTSTSPQVNIARRQRSSTEVEAF
ncbi:hypothetical protein B0I35DRAFT_421926 [Stachybotrys elegans]|uniref:Uncharacterized protein n=1 Tax=Stachybotrys elegans TaxID=80388 RepID=A0A8K0SY10_9HYPO|nr:hypothetical protein B0I35DRAFT_421926 [Stachybotrys elegans]